MRKRIFHIMQYEKHPTEEKVLLTEKQILDALSHKTIKKWAYICHDKDVYTEEEERKFGKKQGEPKPKHWHIVCRCDNAIEITTLAEWFGIEPQYIDVPRGHGAFLDCVEYLTHESEKQQLKGKTLYIDDDVVSNFDYRTELRKRAELIEKYGHELSPKEQMRYDVMYEGKTLKQCIEEDKMAYLNDMDKLKKCRLEYISNQKPPATRINYYISGRGGIGKGLMSRAIARSLYPDYVDDDDIFFEVGAKGAAFEGYDGQPVIIWNDRRAIDLLLELNGRGNVFNVFDTHPTRQKQNVKYSSINLCNEVTIINGVEPYQNFLDGLAGEYKSKDGEEHTSEDKGQSYRRFPFIIPIRTNDIDIMINKGFMENSSDYEEYLQYQRIRGNMQQIAIFCASNEALAREIEAKTILPIVEKHKELVAREQTQLWSDDTIREMFSDYGKEVDEHSETIVDDDLCKDLTDEEKEILKLW